MNENGKKSFFSFTLLASLTLTFFLQTLFQFLCQRWNNLLSLFQIHFSWKNEICLFKLGSSVLRILRWSCFLFFFFNQVTTVFDLFFFFPDILVRGCRLMRVEATRDILTGGCFLKNAIELWLFFRESSGRGNKGLFLNFFHKFLAYFFCLISGSIWDVWG